jgi:hypothetical protein
VNGALVHNCTINTMNGTMNDRNKDKLTNSKTIIKYGFLYDGFMADSYYWECVIMFRKVAVVAISVFLKQYGTYIQTVTAILVLVIALLAHTTKKPYTAMQLNNMKYYGLSTSVLTMYLGLFLFDQKIDIDSNAGVAITVTILFVNIAWLLVSLYFLFITFFQRIFRCVEGITRKMFSLSSNQHDLSGNNLESPPATEFNARAFIIKENHDETKLSDEVIMSSNNLFVDRYERPKTTSVLNPMLQPQRNINDLS